MITVILYVSLPWQIDYVRGEHYGYVTFDSVSASMAAVTGMRGSQFKINGDRGVKKIRMRVDYAEADDPYLPRSSKDGSVRRRRADSKGKDSSGEKVDRRRRASDSRSPSPMPRDTQKVQQLCVVMTKMIIDLYWRLLLPASNLSCGSCVRSTNQIKSVEPSWDIIVPLASTCFHLLIESVSPWSWQLCSYAAFCVDKSRSCLLHFDILAGWRDCGLFQLLCEWFHPRTIKSGHSSEIFYLSAKWAKFETNRSLVGY